MLTVRSLTPALDRMFTLDRELDRALDDKGSASVWYPATDVVETGNSYLIALDLPGVSPDGVDLSFERNTITVRGTKAPTAHPTEDSELRIFCAERMSGAFERSFRLPPHVDGETIEAAFENGVLTITVPKKAAALPRKIAINGAEKKIAG